MIFLNMENIAAKMLETNGSQWTWAEENEWAETAMWEI